MFLIDASDSSLSPGWYPDPQRPGDHRWWDGSSWSHFATDPQPRRRSGVLSRAAQLVGRKRAA